MGINLIQSTFRQLFMLVLKRVIYLVAKLISFKGLAFVVGCFFLKCGIISGVVWCSLVFGIIANRTGKEIITKIKSETPETGV
ncbi:hypothetical protein [Treponema sp. C6A8]|uniref:hypothetical protein n=1 Tax=Treponema sp. C6A8 TaxID=1410609 RepID=UPI00048575FA|nr:hypothetical protein [Treponema sp. C6A8]